jgi:REP element-mobilizing transposase RayT/DNA-binding response OmpR family regulator
MPTPVLMITSDVPFGEQIRQILEETGRFVVGVTGDEEAATVYAREFNPALAFLDTSLNEIDLLKIGAILRNANPGIIFVVVSEEAGWYSALEELFPRDYLSKPFRLPDLQEMINRFFGSSTPPEISSQVDVEATNDLPWLSDVTRAAQHLTRLTLESSAQAALINRGDQLWAYAGQLPQPAARELAETLSRYWNHQEENDLVRFVRLTSTNAEHMLYATRLAENMVLALVFDAETPFSTIRTQASQLVQSLSTSPIEENPEDIFPGNRRDRNPDLLSDIPAQRPPAGHPVGFPYDFETGTPGSRKVSGTAIPVSSPGSRELRREYSLEEPLKSLVDTEQTEAQPAPPEETFQSQGTASRNKTQKADLDPEENEAANQNAFNVEARTIILEPVSAAVYNLDYACLLVPRFPHHHITGDLLDRLGEWVPHVCIAYAWRLEYISVRPEYLQWIVNVPPATAPAFLMRMMRKHTSERIFSEFPRLKKENPSGEFWAPGYLIMGGSQPPPAQLIKDFIAQTRQKQGIPQQFTQ